MNYRFQKLWQFIGVFLVAFIVTISLMHKPPAIIPPFKFADKVGHFMAYLILMGWYVQLFRGTAQRVLLVVLFIGMGVGLEVIQGMGGVRFFEWADALANSLGAIAGFLLGRTGFQYWLQRFESKFFKANEV